MRLYPLVPEIRSWPGARGMLAVLVGAVSLLSACGENPVASEPAAPIAAPEQPSADVVTLGGVDVYVHAHQDDWQLFMGDHVAGSAVLASKVVLVYTTAGDAGDDRDVYWQTREKASQASFGVDSWACGKQTVRGHPITRCTKGKVVSYYMRMPDGNYWDGTGYGWGGLSALRDQGIATTARDKSTTYTSWADFQGTIAGIIEQEGAGRKVSVHAPDHDRNVNQWDHPDHWATADAVKAATAGRGWDLAWYVDYHSETMPVNLPSVQNAAKLLVFGAYDKVMAAAGFETLFDRPRYQGWLQRTYYRTEDAPVRPERLKAEGVRNGANRRVELDWGGEARVVDVWRNGKVVKSGLGGRSSYTDELEKKSTGTFTYQVCTTGKSGAENCSNTAAVTF